MDSYHIEIPSKICKFPIIGIGECELVVPETVYPPREDTLLLCDAISKLKKRNGRALEIGCGSGAVTMQLASLGWNVISCDVNPYAVSATRGNVENHGLSALVEVHESGIGEGMEIPSDVELLVWNIPYLEMGHESEIPEMEAVALNDVGNGGWGAKLLGSLEIDSEKRKRDLLILILMRTDPISESNPSVWKEMGWSARSIAYERIGNERLEVIGFWKTGQGVKPTILDICDSTMDEAKKLENIGWQRVLSFSQRNGRGRRGTKWISMKDGLSSTWKLDAELFNSISPGLLQTSIGSVLSDALNAEMKWPNDIITKQRRKIGGVLIESSDSDDVRIGFGANRTRFEEGEISGGGWEETLGDIDAMDVFRILDTAVSSLLEDNEWFELPNMEELRNLSWRKLSRVLSEGVIVEIAGVPRRPVGLSKDGEMEIFCGNGLSQICDLDGTNWLL
ncbi:MAG: methyltransferase [Candidatus Thalassarchaeum sp.]|nr:methyltransferase [Candidatus Thalassarchaeum sp.]